MLCEHPCLENMSHEVLCWRLAPSIGFPTRPEQRQAIGSFEGLPMFRRFGDTEGKAVSDRRRDFSLGPIFHGLADTSHKLGWPISGAASGIQPLACRTKSWSTSLVKKGADERLGREWTFFNLPHDPVEERLKGQSKKLPHLNAAPCLECTRQIGARNKFGGRTGHHRPDASNICSPSPRHSRDHELAAVPSGYGCPRAEEHFGHDGFFGFSNIVQRPSFSPSLCLEFRDRYLTELAKCRMGQTVLYPCLESIQSWI